MVMVDDLSWSRDAFHGEVADHALDHDVSVWGEDSGTSVNPLLVDMPVTNIPYDLGGFTVHHHDGRRVTTPTETHDFPISISPAVLQNRNFRAIERAVEMGRRYMDRHLTERWVEMIDLPTRAVRETFEDAYLAVLEGDACQGYDDRIRVVGSRREITRFLTEIEQEDMAAGLTPGRGRVDWNSRTIRGLRTIEVPGCSLAVVSSTGILAIDGPNTFSEEDDDGNPVVGLRVRYAISLEGVDAVSF